MRVASIDIGYKNLAILVESFDETSFIHINIPKTKLYDSNHEPTEEMKNFLNEIYMNGKIIFIEKKKIMRDEGKNLSVLTLRYLTEYLKTLTQLFLSCDCILIEKQMETNKKAKRLEYHIESFLINLFIDNKSESNVIIYPSSNKTKILGAPKMVPNKKTGNLMKMTTPQRKKWSEEEMKKILLMRGDMNIFNKLFVENKKADDISDCETMLQSFKFKILCEKLKIKRASYGDTDGNELCRSMCENKHEIWKTKIDKNVCRECLFSGDCSSYCKYYGFDKKYIKKYDKNFVDVDLEPIIKMIKDNGGECINKIISPKIVFKCSHGSYQVKTLANIKKNIDKKYKCKCRGKILDLTSQSKVKFIFE
jgi:hypothetical protein